MCRKSKSLYFLAVIMAFILMDKSYWAEAQTWSGHTETYSVLNYRTCKRCLAMYWWGCTVWRTYSCNYWSTSTRCQIGWTHVNYNCSIPICNPSCANGGVCILPNTCDCNGTEYTGFSCGTALRCSHVHPCYPGICYEDTFCNCTLGFSKFETTELAQPGCMQLDISPVVSASSAILKFVQNSTSLLIYDYRLDGNDEDTEAPMLWSNQMNFNFLSVEFESAYIEQEEPPVFPFYVQYFQPGIVSGQIALKLYDKDDAEYIMQRLNLTCENVSQDTPIHILTCAFFDVELEMSHNHGDRLEVSFVTNSGGLRVLTDGENNVTEYLTQSSRTEKLTFKFDFLTARHCSFNETLHHCDDGAKLLDVGDDVTRTPLNVQWKGWVDSDAYSSGVMMYYLELHKLVVKDNTFHLEEENPLVPLETREVMHMGGTATQVLHNTSFTPSEPGMYSVLMGVRDNANNSIYARRFVLYDPVSEVTLNPDSPHGLHVLSAEEDSGYKWQNVQTDISVDWTGYFRNKLHADGHFLDEIKTFPVLFQDFENLGIRNSEKFVFDTYDDVSEGRRTRSAIPNAEGIIAFDYSYKIDDTPRTPWNNMTVPLTSLAIPNNIANGGRVSVYVRAFDIMGNMREASTTVYMDYTAPLLGPTDPSVPANETEVLTLNAESSDYNYTTVFDFYANDPESGIIQVDLITTLTFPGHDDVIFQRTVNANFSEEENSFDGTDCLPTLDKTKCFREKQKVHLDNCLFMPENRNYTMFGKAHVDVIVYNQARTTNRTSFWINNLADMKGVYVYKGPENLHAVEVTSDGFRLEWENPDSCFNPGSFKFVLMQKVPNGTKAERELVLLSSLEQFEVKGLKPGVEYTFDVYLGTSEALSSKHGTYAVTTQPKDVNDSWLTTEVIIGFACGAVGLIIIIAIVIRMMSTRRRSVSKSKNLPVIQELSHSVFKF